MKKERTPGWALHGWWDRSIREEVEERNHGSGLDDSSANVASLKLRCALWHLVTSFLWMRLVAMKNLNSVFMCVLFRRKESRGRCRWRFILICIRVMVIL
jgi:hypothetical protein